MFENVKRTELSELGEFGLIDHLTSDLKLFNHSTIKGIGDDAAVIDTGNKYTLVTTDLMVEGIHFDLVYTPLKHLGYKAAVTNFSDIYAMNGTPKQMVISLAVSNRYSVEALEEIYAGIKLACEKYHVDFVGGDTSSSTSGLFISVTVIGEIEKDDVIYRSSAKEHDLICVTGDLGAAYAGLLILQREKQAFLANPHVQPDFGSYDYPLQRQLRPEARKDIIQLFADIKVKPTSMIDISDGLASEVLHLCNQSKLGCMIYEEKIPIDPSTALLAGEFNISPVTFAMNGGEDYELLFTISQNEYEKVKNIREISVIGHMTDYHSGCSLISNDGKLLPIEAQGWNHMKKN